MMSRNEKVQKEKELIKTYEACRAARESLIWSLHAVVANIHWKTF